MVVAAAAEMARGPGVAAMATVAVVRVEEEKAVVILVVVAVGCWLEGLVVGVLGPAPGP